MNYPDESGDDAPGDGYEGYPAGWAEFLEHEVGGEFREDVGYEEDGDGDLELGCFEERSSSGTTTIIRVPSNEPHPQRGQMFSCGSL